MKQDSKLREMYDAAREVLLQRIAFTIVADRDLTYQQIADRYNVNKVVVVEAAKKFGAQRKRGSRKGMKQGTRKPKQEMEIANG